MIEISTTFKGIFKKYGNTSYCLVEKIRNKTIEEYNKINGTYIDNLKIYIPKDRAYYATNNCEVEVKLENNDFNKEKIRKINNNEFNFDSKENLEGYVIKVKLTENARIVGVFKKSKTFGFVVPDDSSFPTDIFIPKKYMLNAKTGDKVVVQIIKFPGENRKVEGKIVEIIGNENDFGVDVLSVIKQAQIPLEFPEDVIEQANKIVQEVDKTQIPYRRDFRSDTIFTIDGDDTKDIDDAITVKKHGENYILNVHIADVSNYVKNNSPLDKEALRRGTSVYLLDRVIPMLPFELSNGICSLNEGEDRFALSCLMEIDKNGNIIDSQVCKSIICVTKKMTYKKVQKILDHDKEMCKEYEPYIKEFELMEELAKILKKKRQKEGYLNLELPEPKIVLNENGQVLDVKKYETSFANEIIEQFMLAANISVAEKFYFLNAPFIYRVHSKPDFKKIEEANEQLYSLGLKIKATPEKIYPYEFAKVMDMAKGKPEEQIVSQIVLHTFKNAIYDNKNEGHFGIGAKYYCHFTSPIRRYPDLFIHRVISNYLENDFMLPQELYDELNEEAPKRALQSTNTEKTATGLERRVTKIKCCEYMEDKILNVYDGMVSSVCSFGFFVELENTIEGLVRYSDLLDGYYEYDEKHAEAINEDNGRKIRIGDKVKVRVIKASKQLEQIDFSLLNDYTNGYEQEKLLF